MSDQAPPVLPHDTPAQDPPQPAYDDIHNHSMDEIATGHEPTVEQPPKVEEPIEEEVNLDDVGKKIAEETAQRVLDEQEARRLAAEEAAKAEEPETPQEDAYALWEKELWEKEKRNPTYTEALNFIKDQAKTEIKSEFENDERTKHEESERVQKIQAEEKERINAFVDDELNDLYTEGKLTKIKDPTNQSDQGLVERREFFKQWGLINQQRRAEGKSEIISATRIFHGKDPVTGKPYYTRPNAQPAGADAPISGNRGSSQPPLSEDNPGYNYEDIKRPWSFFKRGK